MTTPSPDGRFIFIAGPGRTADGAVSAFTVGANGSLAEVPGSSCPGGVGPVGTAALPNGRFVYVSTDVGSGPADPGTLDAYTVDDHGSLVMASSVARITYKTGRSGLRSFPAQIMTRKAGSTSFVWLMPDRLQNLERHS
jgi:hypothetical protein